MLLSNEQINQLFPFHLLINNHLIIETCGTSMKKLHDNCNGELFTDCFQLLRPVKNNINFKVLVELVDQLVLIILKNGPNVSTTLKGQFVYLAAEHKLLFTGTPWFNTIEELRKANLMINDFPHHNPTIDLLHMVKTQEIINQDLNQLVITINEQKNKLKIGEEQILISLQKERELSQIKSNYVNLASHEFRTPLACIRSSIELMQIISTRPGNQLKNIIKHQNNIVLEVDHLNELIDEVLTVGKIEASRFTCKKESVDLRFFLLKIIDSLNSIQDDGRVITLLVTDQPMQIMADPMLLKHILSNLLSNSFKYSKGKQQPAVTIIYQKENVQIEITDFGIGIPLHQQDKIFQAFFRADNVDHISGTGLGMFITKNFIELHGGNISFKSIPKKGTSFLMTLPLN